MLKPADTDFIVRTYRLQRLVADTPDGARERTYKFIEFASREEVWAIADAEDQRLKALRAERDRIEKELGKLYF
jgi:hypothetical protein